MEEQKKDNKKAWILIGITLLLAILLNLYNKGYFSFQKEMIPVPLYPSGYPCKCNGKCDYSKAYEEAGKPLYIDYESYIKQGFQPQNETF